MSTPSSADAAASSHAACADTQEQQQQVQREQQREKEEQATAAAATVDDAAKEQKKKQEQMERDIENLTGPELQLALRRIENEKVVISSEIMELQQDLSEHRVVLEAFKNVESTRACFRLVGGVLVQRTVAEVQPVLEAHKQKVEAALEQRDRDLNSLTEKQTAFSRRYLQATGQDLQSACVGPSGSKGDGGRGTGDKAQQQQRSAGGAGILV